MILLHNYLPPFLKGGRGGFCLIVVPLQHPEIPPSPPLKKGGTRRALRFATVSLMAGEYREITHGVVSQCCMVRFRCL